MKPVPQPAATAVTCIVAAVLAVAMSAPARAEGSAASTTARFWRAPSINAFAGHLQHARYQHVDRLENERATTADDGPSFAGWQYDPQLERMKAWLEKGIVAAPPPSMPTWSETQAHARRIGVIESHDAVDGAEALNATIGLWPGSTWLASTEGSTTPHAAALVRSIELPAVRPSWLTSESEVALGHDDAEQLSGRFGVVHRLLRVDAPADTQAKPMFSDEVVGVALTRPLVKTVIHRDGRLDATATHGYAQRVVWGEGMGSNACEGFVPGFALGDADHDFHAATGMDAYARSQSARMQPVDSVLSIVTRDALPVEQALPTLTKRALDVESTGFASSTQIAYDVDADGVADLVVWEGRGAPVPVDGRDTSLLRHRIFFANVQGEWRVLGHDAVAFDCGHGC